MPYFLMDLERTIAHECPYYWKGDQRGYTNNVDIAGIFSKENADELVKQDLDNMTVKLKIDSVANILFLDMKRHEG